MIDVTDDIPWYRKRIYSGQSNEKMYADVGCDLYIPSFPLGFSSFGGLPITKRASLASQIELFESFVPEFYVDTASREGMSGAPVFLWSNTKHWITKIGSDKPSFDGTPFNYRLLGVYSGREQYNDDENKAQLGRVHAAELIAEIIASGVEGSFELVAP